MNIFSNIGVTELVLILLLALIVVGPERLPEIGQKIGKTLRDVRKAYDSLARDIGPELASLQKTTQELRESVQAVQSIPKDAVKSLVEAADLEDTVSEISEVRSTVAEVGKTLSSTGRMLRSPVSAAASTAQASLLGNKTDPASETERQTAQAALPGAHDEQSAAAGPEKASTGDDPLEEANAGEEVVQERTASSTGDLVPAAESGQDDANE